MPLPIKEARPHPPEQSARGRAAPLRSTHKSEKISNSAFDRRCANFEAYMARPRWPLLVGGRGFAGMTPLWRLALGLMWLVESSALTSGRVPEATAIDHRVCLRAGEFVCVSFVVARVCLCV